MSTATRFSIVRLGLDFQLLGRGTGWKYGKEMMEQFSMKPKLYDKYETEQSS